MFKINKLLDGWVQVTFNGYLLYQNEYNNETEEQLIILAKKHFDYTGE